MISKKNKTNIILLTIFIIGIILRLSLAYFYELPYFSYDIGIKNRDYSKLLNSDYDYLEEHKQLDYIITIYSTHKLPNSAENQFYHPPLSHFNYAITMKFISFFTTNPKYILESLEILSIIYSIITIFICYKILKEIGFQKNETLLPIALITFNPLSIWLSRLVNTDGLVNLFIMLTILYLIKYYKNPTYKNSIFLGLSIGLGTISKFSTIVMFSPIIFTFIVKLIKASKEPKKFIQITLHGLVFSLIAGPLVLWWPIRSFYKFNQPFFAITPPLEKLAVANNSFFARWIPNKELFANRINPTASNIWSYLIISTIDFADSNIMLYTYDVSIILRITSIILIIISFYSILKYTFEKNEHRSFYIILSVTYFSWLLSYIYFNVSIPYSCSMHSRYIVCAIYISIIFIGILYNKLNDKFLKNLLLTLSMLFIILTIIFFIILIIIKAFFM